jgi:CRISPR system Cascade subunit CasC
VGDLNSAPRNLANAFETAIRVHKDESITEKSVRHLVEKAERLQAAYGGSDKTFVLNLTATKLDGFGISLTTLKELLEKSLNAVKE